MINFLSSISLIKQGFARFREAEKNNNDEKKERKDSLDQKVEQILLDSKKEEDIIFYHYGKNFLIKLNCGDKNSFVDFPFLEYDIDIEDDKIYLDEKEIENIKTYHVLNVLKPKVETYLSYKDIQFNCTFMRNLYSYAEEIGYENTIGYLIPLIQDLHFQKDKGTNILMAFLDTFEKLLIYLRQYDTDHSIILKKLLPIISQILLNKKEMPLLNKAVAALYFLIKNITMDECLNNIIPFLIEMANNEKNETGQTISIQIFSDQAKVLGGENIELYVLPMYQSFCESLNDNIRLSCIKYMIPLFANVDYNIIQSKFIKIYTNFTKDKNFQIRRTSCNLLPSVCKAIINNNNNYDKDKNIKKEELISKNLLKIFFSFTEDEGKEIQNYALSIFGEFIYYLDNETIISNPNLLDYYVNKINNLFNLYKNKKIDFIPLYKACYSFPSVILIYCQKIKDENEINKNWSQLKQIYLKFIKSKEFKIKYSIASSLGEISSILNEKIAETEISPLITEMFYNNGAKIKNVIINIIPKHLNQVKNAKIKSEFLVIYKKGFNNIKNIKNWREKINYLEGIKKLGNFFENDIVFDDLVGMLIELCFDPYNVIRKKSAKILSIYLLKFLLLDKNNDPKKDYNSEGSENSSEKEVDFKQNSILILNNFATCTHFHYRQLFFDLCKKIIKNEKKFKDYAFNLFNDLSYDKIVNVRYSLSSFINKIWNKNKKEYEWIKNNNEMIEIIYRLKNDKNDEVKKCLEKIDINEENIEDKEKVLEVKEVNSKFINEFQDFKKIFDYEPFLGKSWTKM
jgi:hypothetical protein